jgi:hypothetical protein
MNDTEKSIRRTIKDNQARIRTLTARTKGNIDELLELVKLQNTYFDLYRENGSKEAFPKALADMINLSLVNAQDIIKDYKYILNRNTPDKTFLEKMGVLKLTQRKDITRKQVQPVSNLIKASSLVGDIRNILKNTNDNDKAIVMSLLEDIK